MSKCWEISRYQKISENIKVLENTNILKILRFYIGNIKMLEMS